MEEDKFVMCPMHEAAPELLVLAKKWLYHLVEIDADTKEEDALIAKIEGK
jgi:hypothetical protein